MIKFVTCHIIKLNPNPLINNDQVHKMADNNWILTIIRQQKQSYPMKMLQLLSI